MARYKHTYKRKRKGENENEKHSNRGSYIPRGFGSVRSAFYPLPSDLYSDYRSIITHNERRTIMFKIDGKTKRLLADDKTSTCGYIYNDGIVIKHEQEFKAKGYEFKKEFIDIFPCDIPIFYRNRNDKTLSSRFIGRIIAFNATLLINGVNRVEIYEGNTSESMKAKGLTCTTITLTTGDGMKIKDDKFSFLSSCLEHQDEKPMSIADWKDDYGRDVVITIHELKKAA
jgi:hypothetical protein